MFQRLHMPRRFRPGDAAYLAGLIDGDGCIGIWRRKTVRTRSGFTYYAEVDISSVHPRFLRSIRDLIGVGTWIRKNRGFKSHRPLYHLKVGPNTLRWLLPLVIPHLRLKRPQAEVVLKHLQTMLKGRHGQSPWSEKCYRMTRKLNQRGRGRLHAWYRSYRRPIRGRRQRKNH